MITRKLFRMALAKCSVISLVAAVTPAVPTLAAVVYQNGEVPANGSTSSEDTVIEELNLASNMTYTVISTATLTIQNVTGGAFKFTAQGYGTFVFEHVDNASMSLYVISTAHVKFPRSALPVADASDFTLDSITLQANGSNSAELVLSGGAKVAVDTFINDGRVTGDGTITARRESRLQLALSSDTTLNVPNGSVCTIGQLADTGYRLTKTGGGKLVVNGVNAAKTKIKVEEGTLEFKSVSDETPTALAKAWFHVDASVAESLTTVPRDGTNYVTRWDDVRGAGYPYAERTIGKNDPFIADATLNGLPVMDFGTTWNSNKRDGYGAAMAWSETLERPMEIFIVEQHNDDMSAIISSAASGTASPTVRNQTLLGTTATYYPLLTGNPDGSNSVSVIGTSATLASDNYRGRLVVDLEDLGLARTSNYHPGYEFHAYGIYITAGSTYLSDETKQAPLNAFASERGNIYGGQRIAECIVYSNQLSAAEREAVSAYLYGKWKNEIAVGELEVAAGATVSVPDGSTVRARILRGGMPEVGGGSLAADLQIADGSLVVSASVSYDPLAAADAWFHVDASASDSLVAEVRDGTNFVTRWMDVRGAGVCAERTIGKADPYLAAGALNGLPAMDFGTTWNSAKTDGYGAAMKWSETLERTMELFVVEQHNEDMKSTIGTSAGSSGPTVRNQTLLGIYGSSYSAVPTLLTGNPETDYDSVRVIGNMATVAGNNYAGWLAVDLDDKGLARDHAYYPGYDFHLYNIYMTGSKYLSDATLSAPLNAFACERSNIYGGQRIAECVVFDRVLSSDERALYGGMLYAKWFNGNGGAASYENATVPAGVTLEMPYQALTLSGSLVIGGCVKAVSVAPFAVTVTDLGASVDGTLDIGTSGGVITLPGNGWDSFEDGEYRLIGASTISGSTTGWKVAMPDCQKKAASTLVVRNDGIYATLARKFAGTILIVR